MLDKMLKFAKAWGPADNYDKSTHIGKMKSHDFLSLLIKFLPGEDTLRIWNLLLFGVERNLVTKQHEC